MTNSKDTNPKDAIGALKAKLSVIPSPVLFDLGLAMLEGAVKYGRHNYRHAGVRSSVYYDAAMGHLMDWWEGQDTDPDSGLSHVTKAIASLVVLRDAMFQNMLTDDRPPRSSVHKADFNAMAAEIIARHADKNPTHYTISDGEAKDAARKTCVWSDGDGEGNWDTTCGNLFTITDGTPKENDLHYCAFCGGNLQQVTYAENEAERDAASQGSAEHG